MTGATAANAQPNNNHLEDSGKKPAGEANVAAFEAKMKAVITIEVADEKQKTEGVSPTASTEDESEEIEIAIEITTFEGEDLANNLSVTSNRGTTQISINTEGEIGASTDAVFFSDDPQVQMGETLTFTVPDELGEVQGGSITFSNLLDTTEGFESALVIAYDAIGAEVMRLLAEGSASGDVTLDISVSFKSLDVKPIDNGAWALENNSDFLIKRIEVATTEAQAGAATHADFSSLLSDFRGLFEGRNFKLQSTIQRYDRQATKDVFRSYQNNDALDDRREDELYLKTQNREKGGDTVSATEDQA